MTQRVQVRHSDVAGEVPAYLLTGELAVNLVDKRLFVGVFNGGVSELATPHDLKPLTLKMGALGWLEALVPATEQLSDFISLSRRAGPAGVFATRTSDGGPGSAGAQGAWAIGAFAINDNASQVQTTYGSYVEVRRNANCGITEGIEVAVINRGDVKQNSPHNWAQAGATFALLLGAGRADVTPNHNPTAALTIAGGDAPNAKWQTGIIIGERSIAVNGAYPDALAVALDMPKGYSVLWRDSADMPAAYIRSDVTTSPNYHGAGGIVFTDSGVQLNSASGAASMALSNTGLLVGGTLQSQGRLTIANGQLRVPVAVYANDTAAGFAGLITGDCYQDASGFMKVKA